MTTWEVDVRSRKTGNSTETIFSGDYDRAYEVLDNWYKNNGMDIEHRDDYLDGTDGVFADIYVTEDDDCPHCDDGECLYLCVNCSGTRLYHREECPYEW